MGIETEYGILGGDGVRQSPMALSALVVAGYDQARGQRGRTRWSYEGEDPLSDARGWRLDRRQAHPSQLTDEPGRGAGVDESRGATTADASNDPTLLPVMRRRRAVTLDRPEDPAAANVLLTNGARLYVDHAHPEYSSPEVTNARDAVLWDRAGEEVMLTAVRALAASPHTPDVRLYKNNVDGKGASYGTHENYLVDRAVDFDAIVRHLTPFLVTRQVFTGAGRVGLGPAGEEPGFQLSQRADYIEAEVGLETTLRRPIINTRDEPHADPARFRRLHVIIGDANCSEVATYLKLGTTSLVLAVLEAVERGEAAVPAAWDGLELADPVRAVQAVSRDLTLTGQLRLADGRELTAVEIQRRYLAGVRAVLADLLAADEAELAVARAWEEVLDLLLTDRTAAARRVEWLAKLGVLEGLRERHGLAWDHAKVQAVDLQWSDVRPERGLFARLRAAGAVDTLVTAEEVRRAVTTPPRDTRAWFRGETVRRYPDAVVAAGWNGVVLDVASEPTLVRLPMTDPLRGTAELTEHLLDACPDAAALVAALTRG
ncbi:proteasome accessory factor A [Salana multivorans]|uniref:Proteasome accessory factor A n=1 Tax=Salana multivorans TaxID=120377 RepID=A0A3N2D0X9_9MICO|nr:depupylase/deamidase Dop [Salana multivorans]ROR93417.1 proteasome accessory factor A [Salana multivorans]